jgi:hypothetical protein
MNDILTNGAEIKQRIISEINNARQSIYLAMAWFTDRDIANAIIAAKERNVIVDIIISSNIQNETVKIMLREASINVHAFETGDERGIMHHKFCLIDNRISINGSYNYSYNASNNNVENIQVSDNLSTYKQLYEEFERLKFNIDHNLNVNSKLEAIINKEVMQPINLVDSFVHQLHNLVFISSEIDNEKYRKIGYEKSKESEGSIEIFRAEYDSIKEEIRKFSTDDSLTSKKNILQSNINTAFNTKISELNDNKEREINTLKREFDIENNQLKTRLEGLKKELNLLFSGDDKTSERGLLQTNKDIEKNKLEISSLEEDFIIKKFWSLGTILSLLGLSMFVFYLSIFFASAIYKVFFEGNVIQASLEAEITPPMPQIVDANAIIKIFSSEGSLFGIMAMFFFLIPVLLSNLKLIGSEKKWVNVTFFWIGILVFDIVVSTLVAINTDKIEKLLKGGTSQMEIWEVVKHAEFWLIFVFGMIPLIITHYLIEFISKAYKSSQRELVDTLKYTKIKFLKNQMIDLDSEKLLITKKINEKESEIKANENEMDSLEKILNNQIKSVESKFDNLLQQIKDIFYDFNTQIQSGKIFTTVILDGVITSFKTGFIEYLPSFYSDIEVANRVRDIEIIVRNK